MSVKVSESTGYGPNTQMSLFGYIMAAVLVIVLLPLIPVLVPVWILWKVFVAEEEFGHSFEDWRRDTGRTPDDRAAAADAELAAAETEATEADDAESEDETEQATAES
ncbi:hypothetical protein NP511_16985 [Natrinema thermotolerans]|uniref:Uncharacterized protein n=1 Tax=Natrinema thermotolerans TaxID=121872 RepID=A0AAF0P9V6_9EURY|nr:hypothetical protein [Natrinema thermotolerans]ELZ10193.1 hypothetical protein C478_14902 [Natrinema thermotolerans DSM 11552]QCC60064.1 hypothetical protein DVR14_16080 [Natrinema thermotolerans]QCC60986.1 hypothetical protein DVR14_20200 [Natrinema thermotolerans]WMT07071.1 hypothetical protein NP511_16985 [Natrinema thermotolerans]